MYWVYFFHGFTSMVVDDLDITCVAVPPFETDPPLLIDANAVLSLPASRQRFKPVGRRNPQIINGGAAIQHPQLAEGNLLDAGR